MTDVTTNPDFNSRTLLLVDLHRTEDAVRMAAEWVLAEPDNANAHAILAWIHLKREDLDAAEAAVAHAIRLAPTWFWPLQMLALVRFDRNDYAESYELTRRCLELDPMVAESYSVLARVCAALDKEGEALDALHRAVQLEPNNAEYLRQLHAREYVSGTPDAEVVPHYFKLRKALALDPNSAALLGDFAQLHSNLLGDANSAERLVRRALEIDPTSKGLQSQLHHINLTRDTWLNTLFLLAFPVTLMIFAAVVRILGKPVAKEWLKFLVYIVIPCIVFGIPILVLIFIPACMYMAMSCMDYWIAPDSTNWRWLRKFGLHVWLRRIVWLPMATAWWGLVSWCLQVPVFWTMVAIVSGIGAVLTFTLWVNRRQRHRRAMVRSVLLSSSSASASASRLGALTQKN